jgi:hypothetical protein
VSRPKTAPFSSEFEFAGRGAAEACKQTRAKGTLHFLGDRTNHKARDIIEKITKFILYLPFQIGKFINPY